MTARQIPGHGLPGTTTITPADAATALAYFQLDFARQYFIIEVSAPLVDQAAALARKHGLRGYDAVQLAAALDTQARLPSLTPLSADAGLNAAALAEGLAVDDPNNHPCVPGLICLPPDLPQPAPLTFHAWPDPPLA